MKEYIVFVYGTLKKGFRLHSYLNNAKFLGEGFVKGYDMYLVDWYPAIVKGKGVVYGEIYGVDEETLEILDKVEDEGFLYKRIKEKIYMKNGKTVEGYIYVYLKSVEGLKPIIDGVFSG